MTPEELGLNTLVRITADREPVRGLTGRVTALHEDSALVALEDERTPSWLRDRRFWYRAADLEPVTRAGIGIHG